MKTGNDSLATRVALFVAAGIIFLAAASLGVNYKIGYDRISHVYRSQMKNVNNSLRVLIKKHVSDRMDELQRLTADSQIIASVVLQEYYGAAMFLERRFSGISDAENLFLSSAETDTKILADSIGGKSVGLEWRKSIPWVVDDLLGGAEDAMAVLKSPLTGRTVLFMAAPVYHQEKLSAFLCEAVYLDALTNDLIRQMKVGESGYVAMIDYLGNVAVHQDKDLVWKLNINDQDWGKSVLKAEDDSFVRYEFKQSKRIMNIARMDEIRAMFVSVLPVSDIQHALNRMIWQNALVTIFGAFLIVFLITRFLKRQITRPLADVVEYAGNIAEGDLTLSISTERKDEIGGLMNRFSLMIKRLAESMGRIRSAALTVRYSNDRIRMAAEDLSESASRQAAMQEEISASMEELTASIQMNADNAGRSREMSSEAGKLMTNAMDSLEETVKAIQKINKRVHFINDLARSVDMLALNAAIEAARAGVHGRGFSVVAAEIRKLADRSGKSAGQIIELSENSFLTAQTTQEKMGEVARIAKDTFAVNEEIAMVCREQATGSEQIKESLFSMDDITQKNAAFSEELAGMVIDLDRQAGHLETVVSQFQLEEMTEDDEETEKTEKPAPRRNREEIGMHDFEAV